MLVRRIEKEKELLTPTYEIIQFMKRRKRVPNDICANQYALKMLKVVLRESDDKFGNLTPEDEAIFNSVKSVKKEKKTKSVKNQSKENSLEGSALTGN
jgi:hypothetical protein